MEGPVPFGLLRAGARPNQIEARWIRELDLPMAGDFGARNAAYSAAERGINRFVISRCEMCGLRNAPVTGRAGGGCCVGVPLLRLPCGPSEARAYTAATIAKYSDRRFLTAPQPLVGMS
jgi:hypothetical protein